MAKIKTLVESLGEGYETAFSNLDQKVESLGDIRITDVKDSVLPAKLNLSQDGFSYLERVVIYEEEGSKSQSNQKKTWKLNPDMDLMEFLEICQPKKEVKDAFEEVYLDMERKTIRELLTITYSEYRDATSVSYRNFAPRKLRYCKGWELLKNELSRHGFKLYRKGNVIKNNG